MNLPRLERHERRHQLMKQYYHPKDPDAAFGYFLGLCIAAPVIALVMFWQNHVLCTPQIGYFKCLVLAALWLAIHGSFKWARRPLSMLASLGVVLCIIAQVLGWLGIVALPLIH